MSGLSPDFNPLTFALDFGTAVDPRSTQGKPSPRGGGRILGSASVGRPGKLPTMGDLDGSKVSRPSTVSGKSRPVGRTNTHVLWTAEEDACLRSLVMEHGEQAWALVASRMPHERNNKQCRERWRNHLRPQCNKGPWTEAEDSLILERVQQHGTKWAKISGLYLPDRPENDIKNRWHILVRMGQHSANGNPSGAAPTFGGLPPPPPRPASAAAAYAGGEPGLPPPLYALASTALDAAAVEAA